MSKRSLFWGNASGKLGETVFYRSGGEQRTRAYVAKIKNPRTLAQMRNRLSMLNFATTYRLMKDILSVSFPNRPSNQSGYNAFMHANKSVTSAVITKDMAQKNLVVPYNMLFSQGNYSPLGAIFRTPSNKVGFEITNLLSAEVRTEINPSSAYADVKIDTTEKLATIINALGLPSSIKITVVKASYADDGFTMSHVTIDNNSSVQAIVDAGLYVSLYDDEETEDSNFSTARLMLSANSIQDPETMYTIILSYKDGNGKLQITTSRMLIASSDDEYVTQFLEGGYVYEQVLEAYGYTEGSVLG